MIIRSFTAVAAALLVTTAAASAGNFSVTGTFTKDNQFAGYSFTLAAPGTVSLVSLGYAGGVNSAGAIIARGGFDSFLSIYDSAGLNIALNDDSALSTADAVSGQRYDANWTAALAAGTYSVYISQYNNAGPAQLPGYFGFQGQPNFRNGFVDFSGSQRNGDYALDIRGVDSISTVPETASTALLLAGLGLLGFAGRRRAR